MYRSLLADLQRWKGRASRKPLVLRGARQVGKTYLVRELARESFGHLLELNFERDPARAALFEGGDPQAILRRLELLSGQRIEPGRTLLFLDEIQAAPRVLATLRYFFEELPELHVIAAGSLLDLALAETAHAMPVGRIEFAHLQPLRFTEFLRWLGRAPLAEWIESYRLREEIPSAIHAELLADLRAFLVVGGMPEVVARYAAARSLLEVDQAQQALLATFRDDFGKYGARVSQERLRKVFAAAPRLVGEKWKYSAVDREERSRDLKPALELLRRARVVHLVHHTSANGVPLGAEIDEKALKVLFLDVGLVSKARGLSLLDFERAGDLLLVGSGSQSEQLVGQELLASLPAHQDPELHYWLREQRGASAELDYVIAVGADVVPVEVKAGKTGTLRSLHHFLREKRRSFGVRLNCDRPSLLRARATLSDGSSVDYALLSLPLYLAGEVRRLCAALREQGPLDASSAGAEPPTNERTS